MQTGSVEVLLKILRLKKDRHGEGIEIELTAHVSVVAAKSIDLCMCGCATTEGITIRNYINNPLVKWLSTEKRLVLTK